MLQKFTITHGPSGRSVVVKAYTADEAHKKGLVAIQKILGVALPDGKATAGISAGSAHKDNTTVTDSKGALVPLKKEKAK